ncbi:hypothetical protein KKA93_03545 [Patescibacteria group bacterium]|nr:hypothetical protein [Patescibacteria group bacterium]
MNENRSNDLKPRPSVSARRSSASKAKQFSFNSLIFRATLFLLKGFENCFAAPVRLWRNVLMPNGENASHPCAYGAEQAGENSFPPTPFLFARLIGLLFFSVELEAVFRKAKCAAKRDVALAPTLPCAGNGKELPKDSFTIFEKLVIIIVSRKNALYYILYTIMLYN